MAWLLDYIARGLRNAYLVLGILALGRPHVRGRRKLDGIEFHYVRAQHPEGPFLPILPISPAPPLKYSKTILRRGHRKEPHFKAIEADMIFEKDVAFTLRDNVKVYADVFRPADEGQKCPAILAWSPYGKHLSNDHILNNMPERLGLPRSEYSGYEDFEGPDPAFWVPRGYAIVNLDIRGSWHSEGNMHFWGKQDELDGYDVIERLAAAEWCSGKVAMAGNSWLAIAQWFIAAANPPSLKAIAPWEGLSDVYRDQHRRGGIPSCAMPSSLGMMVPSLSLQEDAGIMAELNPVWNTYWQDKKVDFSKIKVPAYVLASYSTKIHCAGSIRGFRNIDSKDKWLRIHPHQEWYDFVKQQDDLAEFFDFFVKGIKNDWSSTPRVRCSLLQFNAPPIVNQPFTDYPPPNTTFVTFHLDASRQSLAAAHPLPTSSCNYAASGKEQVNFKLRFEEKTTVIGYPTIQLNMACKEHNDLDVFVMIRKLNEKCVALEHINFPTSTVVEAFPQVNPARYKGSTGMLRASHRKIANSNETAPGELFHPHDSVEQIPNGEIVTLQLSTWPVGIVFAPGEYLQLSIAGRDMCYPESELLPVDKNCNKGSHTIHTGGQYKSWIKIPILQAT